MQVHVVRVNNANWKIIDNNHFRLSIGQVNMVHPLPPPPPNTFDDRNQMPGKILRIIIIFFYVYP